MRKGFLHTAAAVGLALGLGLSATAHAAPVLDCPLGRQPLSTQSPLGDVLVVPAAKAVVEAASPGLSDAMMHPFNGNALPPASNVSSRRDRS
ncbi:hypothetical protein [Novosphingobium sp. THN1]|uniref:hypothetical protein n=1 Tax=Novosphingobium sp. THN1 TaxID=1016987 RepID=UPI001F08834E|nr:hypothetical protein [Novosphingobium sp. THN1]